VDNGDMGTITHLGWRRGQAGGGCSDQGYHQHKRCTDGCDQETRNQAHSRNKLLDIEFHYTFSFFVLLSLSS
jgi:hypothetical protein